MPVSNGQGSSILRTLGLLLGVAVGLVLAAFFVVLLIPIVIAGTVIFLVARALRPRPTFAPAGPVEEGRRNVRVLDRHSLNQGPAPEPPPGPPVG